MATIQKITFPISAKNRLLQYPNSYCPNSLCIFISNFSVIFQGASSPDPTTVYVDLRALRNDRVTLTERGAPHSLALMESGKLLPGLNVIIANPDTKGQCGDSHLGEVCEISFVYFHY
jgi:hypothetical protein